MSKLIFLYADKDSPVSDDVPSISMPYKGLKEFKKENSDLKPWASYSMDHLLKEWGVSKEIDKIKKQLEEKTEELEGAEKVIKEVLPELEWARMTYKDKLTFGMPEDQAIRRRERRYNGVFMTTISKAREYFKAKEGKL